jgi:hypothetical protein
MSHFVAFCADFLTSDAIAGKNRLPSVTGMAKIGQQ